MRKITRMVAAIGCAVTLAMASLGVAEAAPAEQACMTGAFRQSDMSGLYISAYHQMRVEIFPCGGSYVQWQNPYDATMAASYYSIGRLPGGGVAAVKLPESYASLDATVTIGFKPAEPGYIETFTVNDYGKVVGVYKLRKIT